MLGMLFSDDFDKQYLSPYPLQWPGAGVTVRLVEAGAETSRMDYLTRAVVPAAGIPHGSPMAAEPPQSTTSSESVGWFAASESLAPGLTQSRRDSRLVSHDS